MTKPQLPVQQLVILCMFYSDDFTFPFSAPLQLQPLKTRPWTNLFVRIAICRLSEPSMSLSLKGLEFLFPFHIFFRSPKECSTKVLFKYSRLHVDSPILGKFRSCASKLTQFSTQTSPLLKVKNFRHLKQEK